MSYLQDLELFRHVTDDMVPGVRPHYQVSNKGRVYSFYSNRFMDIRLDHHGYCKVCLSRYNGKAIHKSVHRLVCMAFKPIPNMDELQVNHINGIKTCNDINNLEWVTPKENIAHAMRTGLRDYNGENSCNATFTNQQVIQICELLKQNLPYKQIMQIMGLPENSATYSKLRGIKSKSHWRSVTDGYDFSDYNPFNAHPVFTRDEVHKICECFQTYSTNVSSEFVMVYLRKQDLYKSLLIPDRKHYHDSISNIRRKVKYKSICDLYTY